MWEWLNCWAAAVAADCTEDDFYCRPCGEVDTDADEQQAAFERKMPLLLRVIKAVFDVLLSHSELLCYFAMVLNAMVTGSLLSVVFPVLAFLWAMLSSPRPSKSFWVFAITYTEVCAFCLTFDAVLIQVYVTLSLFSVLWHCWFGIRKGVWPVETGLNSCQWFSCITHVVCEKILQLHFKKTKKICDMM